MNDEIEKIEDSFKESFLVKNFSDVSADIAESVIDSLVDDELVKEIPIVKTVYAIGKTIFGIRQKAFMRKVVKFLFLTDSISIEDKQRFIASMNKETENKISEIVLQLIDNFDHDGKVKILSNLVQAKVEGKITSEVFLRLSRVTQLAFLKDFHSLVSFWSSSSCYDKYATDNLHALGLISWGFSDIKDLDAFSIHNSLIDRRKFQLTPQGRDLLRYGLNLENKKIEGTNQWCLYYDL